MRALRFPFRESRALEADELAHAAVMGALAALISIISVIVPFGQSLTILGIVIPGLLACRHRLRVVVSSTAAACMIAFLIAGLGGLFSVINAAYVGGLVGLVKRAGRGRSTLVALALLTSVSLSGSTIAILAVSTRLRLLLFTVITAAAEGVATALDHAHLSGAGATVHELLSWGLRYWPFCLSIYIGLTFTIACLVAWALLSRLLNRMQGLPDSGLLTISRAADERRGPIRPVPVLLDEIRFRYPDADHDALQKISLEVNPGEHLAVTGANGSGKTTLMLILAGREPTSGTVRRTGSVGLGQPGGTAVVLQHAQSQILGTRVADDVVWGLPPGDDTDVAGLLDAVGLTGLEERDTGSLSGGELQRLALAGALARRPALLIADEMTAMVDPSGREELLKMLRELTGRQGSTLVHFTHDGRAAAAADRTINLDRAPAADRTVTPRSTPAALGDRTSLTPVLELVGVGHGYSAGTPWATTVLTEVNLKVVAGDGVLIQGDNGTGKSTLAWIMAGLTIPVVGSCLIDGVPAHKRVGSVALAFQTARLQLLRGYVGQEVASAAGFAGVAEQEVRAALAAVGLDPALAGWRVDQLSGGQMRRVVLAGLLARSPRALILDEPLAGLDPDGEQALLRVLDDLRNRQGIAVVIVAHQIGTLAEVCPRVLRLENGMLDCVRAGIRS